MTSYNIIQHHTTSYNIIQHHTTSYDVIRRHTTSYNIILHHSISPLCGIFKSKLGTFGQPPSLCEMFLNYRLLFYFKSFPNIHCTIKMGGGTPGLVNAKLWAFFLRLPYTIHILELTFD